MSLRALADSDDRSAFESIIRERLGDDARVRDVRGAGGNAGFSVLVTVDTAEGSSDLFVRLPPPGVQHRGIADLSRQARVLRALEGSGVPHARLVASGSDPQLGPYLVTETVPGATLGAPGAFDRIDDADRELIGDQAMTALARLHAIDWRDRVGDSLGPFTGQAAEVLRWDGFFERGAFADELRESNALVRELLLRAAPAVRTLALCHGDYQFGNLMFDDDRALTAVIDWELCGVHPAGTDVGWILAFHDDVAWGKVPRASTSVFTRDQLLAGYRAAGGEVDSIDWYQALAHYKYAVIASLNVSLHRRGKRVDEEWERRAPGAFTHMARAKELLGAG